jgi:MFS family permease
MDIRRSTNAYRLLWAGFFAIFAAGVGFAVRARVLGYWAADYGFTMAELGLITGGGLTGFGLIILLGSFIADHVGYGKLMIFALIMHLLSAVLQMCTQPIYQAVNDMGLSWLSGRDAVYYCLYVAMFLFAIGNGTCEVVVNPVVATLFPEKKTHYLNILHAGWPGGLIAGGVVAYFMNGGGIGDFVLFPDKVHWLIQMSMFLVPVAIYGFMVLGQDFPKSEAGQAGVGYGTMLLQVASPVFLLLLLLHAMVGYVELGTDSWISLITGKIMEDPNKGLLLFIYTSGLMFTLRFFGGPIEHRMSPLGLLCLSAVLGCIGLTLLSAAEGILICVIAATVYALGKTFLWPTMLAVASERFPKGGAITIGMVGGVGALSAGLLGGPGIGFKQDYYATQELLQKNSSTYDRYKTAEPNTFLIFHVQGIDGGKRNVLELAGKLDKTQKDINDPTNAAKKADLEQEAASLQKELDAALKIDLVRELEKINKDLFDPNTPAAKKTELEAQAKDIEKKLPDLAKWWLPPGGARDSSAKHVLDLNGKLKALDEEINDANTSPAKKTELEAQAKNVQKELVAIAAVLTIKSAKLNREINDPGTPADKKSELEAQAKELQKERYEALEHKAVLAWWAGLGEPHKSDDLKPVESATLDGGRMALLLTAAVPAVMAVLYLGLILYFRARGGYTKELVGARPDKPAGTPPGDGIGVFPAGPGSEHVYRPDTDLKK